MLRLKSTEFIDAFDAQKLNRPEGHVAVVFTGPAGDHATCRFTVYVEDQSTDAALLTVARAALRRAVVHLAHELQTEGVPQSAPTDS